MVKILTQNRKNNKYVNLKVLKRCKRPLPGIRISREMQHLINKIRAKYLLEGKKPPTISKITEMIAKNINYEDLLRNEFIKF